MPRLERERNLPDFLTLDYQRTRYDSAVRRAKEVAEPKLQSLTPEAGAILHYLLAQSIMLRPVVNHPQIKHSEFLNETGGGAKHNREKKIDVIGGEIGKRILRESGIEGVRVHVEEHHQWETPENDEGLEPLGPGIRRFVLIDPLDETNKVGTKEKGETTGIAIFDADKKFVAGGIASLSRGEKDVLLIDGGSVIRLEFDENNDELRNHPQVTLFERAKDNISRLRTRIAYLDQRAHEIEESRLKKLVSRGRSWRGFGGWGILALHRGELDVMMDPIKGQKWYELLIWGPIAEASFWTTDQKGRWIDYESVLHRVLTQGINTSGVDERSTVLIARDTKLGATFVKTLTQGDEPSKRVRGTS